MFHNEAHSPLYLLEKRAEVALQSSIFGPVENTVEKAINLGLCMLYFVTIHFKNHGFWL